MTKRVTILLTDDLDGGEATQTVRFALDGRELEIDLTDENAIKLRKTLLPFIAAGRRSGNRIDGSQPSRARANTSSKIRDDLTDVRSWAKANGYDVSDRGRVKGDILEAYLAASG